MSMVVQDIPRTHRTRTPCLLQDTAWQSDYRAFGIGRVKYADAMRSAAELRRIQASRLKVIESFLAMSEEEYSRHDAAKGRFGIERLEEIRGWFSGELEFTCKALGLELYPVCEKAAIYEFDAGYSRWMSEIMALRDFLQRAGRYDGDVKELVESGDILTMARECIDQQDAESAGRAHPLYGN